MGAVGDAGAVRLTLAGRLPRYLEVGTYIDGEDRYLGSISIPIRQCSGFYSILPSQYFIV